MNELVDFTQREFRPDHDLPPTPKGIPYDPFRTPQQMGALLCKAARKHLRGRARPAKIGVKK